MADSVSGLLIERELLALSNKIFSVSYKMVYQDRFIKKVYLLSATKQTVTDFVFEQ